MNIEALVKWAKEKLIILKKLTIFIIKPENINILKADGVPDTINSKLLLLSGNDYKEQDDFIEAIKLQIGENDTIKYQWQILQSCCVAVSD